MVPGLGLPITHPEARTKWSQLCRRHFPWWRHQMDAIFALPAICAGNSPVTGEFPAQRQVTRSFDVFFDLRLNKRLSRQSWGWWFETPWRPLWRHCNVHGRLTVNSYLLRQWFGAELATKPYLNQWWHGSPTHIWVIRTQFDLLTKVSLFKLYFQLEF